MSPKSTKTDPKVESRSEAAAPVEATATNLSPGDAADLMVATVLSLRKQWLQSAVTVASALKNGQTIHRASFEDLRKLRENYEELERARIILRKIDLPTETDTGEEEQENGA